MPPARWRAQEQGRRSAEDGVGQFQDSKPGQELRNPGQVPARGISYRGPSYNATPEGTMQVRLIERRDTPVAYLRHLGPYGPGLLDFWQRSVYPWMVTNDLLGRPRLGICHDDPAITAAARCRYDACVEAPEGSVLSGNYHRTVIPGGRYAALAFRGTAADAPAGWASLLRDWLPASGLQLDARPFFEFYPQDSTWDPATGIFTCQLCVPVAPI